MKLSLFFSSVCWVWFVYIGFLTARIHPQKENLGVAISSAVGTQPRPTQVMDGSPCFAVPRTLRGTGLATCPRLSLLGQADTRLAEPWQGPVACPAQAPHDCWTAVTDGLTLGLAPECQGPPQGKVMEAGLSGVGAEPRTAKGVRRKLAFGLRLPVPQLLDTVGSGVTDGVLGVSPVRLPQVSTLALGPWPHGHPSQENGCIWSQSCLLYTSDAADDWLVV